MRVGIDYLPAIAHAPGIGRAIRELVRALVPLVGPVELALLEIGRGRRAVPEAALGLDGRQRRRRLAVPRRALRLGHRMIGIGADDLAGGVAVFHHATLPPLPVRRAAQTIALGEAPARDGTDAAAVARALAPLDAVLVYSGEARDRLLRLCGLSPDRVHVVPVGADHWRRALLDAGGALVLPEPADPPELLVLGAPRPGRHHEVILAAYERLRAGGIRCRLRVVGGRPAALGAWPEWERALARSPVRAEVAWDAPDEAALPGLVARAAALVHLADDEATAVTPLEAFAVGTPVVASRLAAFEEALDGRSTLLEPRGADGAVDPVLLADALARVLGAGREDGAEERRAVAARFTWRRHAAAVLDVWAALAARGSA